MNDSQIQAALAKRKVMTDFLLKVLTEEADNCDHFQEEENAFKYRLLLEDDPWQDLWSIRIRFARIRENAGDEAADILYKGVLGSYREDLAKVKQAYNL